MQDSIVDNNITHKPGKTLIVRYINEFTINDFKGLVTKTPIINKIQFIVFDSIDNSVNAFNILKQKYELMVKFAYYRLFFTMTGVDENDELCSVQQKHIKWITDNCNANVLDYKQYIKKGQFIGCGNITIDTKEVMDKFLNKEELKSYSFDKYTGMFYS